MRPIFNSDGISQRTLRNVEQPSEGSLIWFRGLVSNLPSYCGASTAALVIDTESKTATYEAENANAKCQTKLRHVPQQSLHHPIF